MIQRIQTLHLLIVTALMAVTLFAPLAWFAGDAGEFRLYAFSLQTSAGEAVQSTVYMGVVLALACVSLRSSCSNAACSRSGSVSWRSCC